MDVELKPCPFCGGKAELSYTDAIMGNAYVQVYCGLCRNAGLEQGYWVCKKPIGASSLYFDNKEEAARAAIAAWNRRVDDANNL